MLRAPSTVLVPGEVTRTVPAAEVQVVAAVAGVEFDGPATVEHGRGHLFEGVAQSLVGSSPVFG